MNGPPETEREPVAAAEALNRERQEAFVAKTPDEQQAEVAAAEAEAWALHAEAVDAAQAVLLREKIAGYEERGIEVTDAVRAVFETEASAVAEHPDASYFAEALARRSREAPVREREDRLLEHEFAHQPSSIRAELMDQARQRVIELLSRAAADQIRSLQDEARHGGRPWTEQETRQQLERALASLPELDQPTLDAVRGEMRAEAEAAAKSKLGRRTVGRIESRRQEIMAELMEREAGRGNQPNLENYRAAHEQYLNLLETGSPRGEHDALLAEDTFDRLISLPQRRYQRWQQMGRVKKGALIAAGSALAVLATPVAAVGVGLWATAEGAALAAYSARRGWARLRGRTLA